MLNGGFEDISDILVKYEIELLPITFNHVQLLLSLDYFHRDPFDRIIISQGIAEKFIIISKDENFKKYNVKIIWDK